MGSTWSSTVLACSSPALPLLFSPASLADAQSEPLKLALAAVLSGLFVVTLAIVMMYLGWAYVGNQLLSATVE
ncbi:unnamed protein product [Camellia sinensis]